MKLVVVAVAFLIATLAYFVLGSGMEPILNEEEIVVLLKSRKPV